MKKSIILSIAAVLVGITLITTAINFVMPKGHAGTASADETSGTPSNLPTPNGYTVLGSSQYGYTVTTEKPNANSTTDALLATFPELAAIFDGHPTISGAYDDSQSHRIGGASFTAQIHGQAVKGFVACRPAAQGSTVTVICCQSNTPNDELAKLTQSLAATANDGAAVQPSVPVTTYQFPDGSGSIDLPDGWHATDGSSCRSIVQVIGPANQQFILGFKVQVHTPDAPEVQALQMSGAPTGGMFISAWDTPTQVMLNIMPAMNALEQSANLNRSRIDRVISSQKAAAGMATGSAETVIADVTWTTANGSELPCRRISRIDLEPMMQGEFMYFSSYFETPRDKMDEDLPAMLQISGSLRPNQQALDDSSRLQANLSQIWFAGEQYAAAERYEAAHEQIQDIDHNMNIMHRSNADADEEILYVRTMLDTHTGEETDENLGDIDGIVSRLNENDPGRYVEIPLRDQLYPTDGH